MSAFFDPLSVAMSISVGISSVLIGANANPERARKSLGQRLDKFGSVDRETLDLELSRAVRATYWGLPGIAFMLVIAVFFRALTYLKPTWTGFLAAMAIAATISFLQTVIYRTGMLRYLERRFATP